MALSYDKVNLGLQPNLYQVHHVVFLAEQVPISQTCAENLCQGSLLSYVIPLFLSTQLPGKCYVCLVIFSAWFDINLFVDWLNMEICGSNSSLLYQAPVG